MSNKEITIKYLESIKRDYENAINATDKVSLRLDLISINSVIRIVERCKEENYE